MSGAMSPSMRQIQEAAAGLVGPIPDMIVLLVGKRHKLLHPFLVTAKDTGDLRLAHLFDVSFSM